MEQVVRVRLDIIKDRTVSSVNSAREMLQNLQERTIQEVQVCHAKLKALKEQLVSEVYKYYEVVKEPSSEELKEHTVLQLEAEEVLAELSVKTRMWGQGTEVLMSDCANIAGKLPTMELAKFNGDVLKWYEFWDQFSSNVHERRIKEVDKLLYLRSVLEGEAKKTIEGLETTSANYVIAIDTLKERYGKPGAIVDAHYVALYRIRAAQNCIKDCRNVLNEIERHLRVLKSLGEDVNHNHLRVMIMEKFPEDLIYELRMRMVSEDESIDNIRKHLEHIISARESSNRIRGNTDEKENFTLENLYVQAEKKKFGNLSSYPSEKRRGFEARASKHLTSNMKKRPYKTNFHEHEPDLKKRAKNCVFCGKDHYNDECSEVVSIQERKSKLKNRCYICLRTGHRSRECRMKKACRHCGKQGEHNRALCPKLERTTPKSTECHYMGTNGGVILQTAVVNICKDGNYSKLLKCRILLDCGSQRSYITNKIVRQMNLLQLEENRLSVFTFGAEFPKEIDSPVVRFNMVTRTDETKTVYANVVPHIAHRVRCSTEVLSKIKNNKAFCDMVMADDGSKNDEIDILIGNDYYNDFILSEKYKISDGLFLINSIFGWVCTGIYNHPRKVRDQLSVLTYFQEFEGYSTNFDTADLPLRNDDLRALWELEAVGITDSPKAIRDEEAVKQYNETVEYKDHRYSVKWPWKEFPPMLLPANYGLATGRLINLVKRLEPKILEMYDAVLREQLQSGIIEIVKDPHESLKHPVHYLPHHCVMSGGASTKLRIVYDASAKVKGTYSLNECLYRGPLLLEDLTGLLIKFREHPIGIIADVEKAFLQIGLRDEDRDVTRFLWIKDLKRGPTRDNILHLRFCRVPFGIVSSPFLLNATIKYHLTRLENTKMTQIGEDIYVDNLVTGANSVPGAASLYESCKTSFNELSMNLREWNSNSKEFMTTVPKEFRGKDSDLVKVLGMVWNLREDHLQLNFNRSPNDIKNVRTKRDVLKCIASIYDPCGFVAPLILPAKKFLQYLWTQKIKWDVPLDANAIEEWQSIAENLYKVSRMRIPRFYARAGNQLANLELHCFTDASKQAYAAVLYLRGTSAEGIFSSFVIGKSRLAPIKDQNELHIPRLELLGVLIGSRLLVHALKVLRSPIQRCFLWTDSQIVLNWCKSDKLLPPFVERRVNEIRKNKDLRLRFVPTHLNPADVATRTNSRKIHNSIWLSGPDFLKETPNKWPAQKITSQSACEAHVNMITGEEVPLTVNDTIREESLPDTESPDEEEPMIKAAQQKYFPQEVANIKTDLARSLRLFKDQRGVLRCEGRYKNAKWSAEQKYPILLPKNNEFTFKIIETTHLKNYHVGVSHTLALVRRKYWIPQGRAQVQKVLRKCQQCKKYGGGPYKLPQMPPLPEERINYQRAFQCIGLDYFGPLMCKDASLEKRWVCLFTCLAVRAVHMEVVKDLSAEECLLAIRRFIASRGTPVLIISDNASQFKLTSDVLSNKYCTENKIGWKFIPELAPWFGGLYERLIGLVKHCLKRTIDKHLLSTDQLVTIIKEIEAVINTRPLTTVGTELEHIISPSDFLHAGGPLVMEMAENEFLPQTATATKAALIEGWKRGQVILKEFSAMFVDQYLTNLRDRRSTHKQSRLAVNAEPQVGDIVQLKKDSSRVHWKTGRIAEVLRGSDGRIRVAKVAMPSGDVLTRSIGHLYPLEMGEGEEEREAPQATAESAAEGVDRVECGEAIQLPRRPVRSSAQKARDKMKRWTEHLMLCIYNN